MNYDVNSIFDKNIEKAHLSLPSAHVFHLFDWYLWKDTSNNKNVQNDMYKNTKDGLQVVCSEHEMKLQCDLISHSWFFSIISQHCIMKVTNAWSTVQSRRPKNIVTFIVKCINNSTSGHICHVINEFTWIIRIKLLPTLLT